MRDKKRFLFVILLTSAIFAGGCGNQVQPVSAESTETVKEADIEESTEESLEPTSSSTVEPEESMESSEVEDNSEKEVDITEEENEQDLEYKIISIDDTVMYATTNCNIRSGASTQYDIVGSLSYAQEVTVNGKVETGEDELWYVMKTEDGSTQMVSASMLSETKPTTQTSSASGSGSSSSSGGSTGNTGNSETASTSSQATPASSETSSAPEPTPTPIPEPTIVPTSTPEPISTPEPTPVHEHNWIAHTNQRWVPQIVTVVDEPERYEEYTIYRMYWYDTGTWEETRDSSRFDAWSHDMNGGLYPLYYIYNIEDHPLFLGYNELGQPSYLSDHAFLMGNYEFIPAVTHEEDQGYYETYVDYYYCSCGAIKQP